MAQVTDINIFIHWISPLGKIKFNGWGFIHKCKMNGEFRSPITRVITIFALSSSPYRWQSFTYVRFHLLSRPAYAGWCLSVNARQPAQTTVNFPRDFLILLKCKEKMCAQVIDCKLDFNVLCCVVTLDKFNHPIYLNHIYKMMGPGLWYQSRQPLHLHHRLFCYSINTFLFFPFYKINAGTVSKRLY